VAEQMKNPFGDDDEDFNLNFLLTRHMKVFPYLYLNYGDISNNFLYLADCSPWVRLFERFGSSVERRSSTIGDASKQQRR
jgi:hypothetical protein